MQTYAEDIQYEERCNTNNIVRRYVRKDDSLFVRNIIITL